VKGNKEKILVIGVGNMGEALIRGMLEGGLFSKEDLFGLEVSKQRSSYIEKTLGIKVFLEPESAFTNIFPTIVLLCVKPQVMEDVLFAIKDFIQREPLFITIAAGVTTQFIEDILGGRTRVVRVMPNTPVLIKEGISAISWGKHTTKKDEEIAKRIFSSVGETVIISEELMDAVTGLSGSGPAYIFNVVDALCEGGVKEGLGRNLSLKLAIQTTLGAAKLLIETGALPEDLCKKVTSPGGTTIRGLEVLQRKGLRSALIEAVRAATQRSRELRR
jgi:pyrroline-5-carboxylate reductase